MKKFLAGLTVIAITGLLAVLGIVIWASVTVSEPVGSQIIGH